MVMACAEIPPPCFLTWCDDVVLSELYRSAGLIA